MDDESGRDPSAIGARAGGFKADVVHLGTEGQMGEQADVHTATKAIGKLVGRAAARSGSDARAAKKHLCEWIDLGGITQSQARAEKKAETALGRCMRATGERANARSEEEK